MIDKYARGLIFAYVALTNYIYLYVCIKSSNLFYASFTTDCKMKFNVILLCR